MEGEVKKDGISFDVNIHYKLEKYAEGVTQEQIESGLVAPIEVIEMDDTLPGNEENKAKFGIKDDGTFKTQEELDAEKGG